MSRPGTFLDCSTAYVYEKTTRRLLADIGVDVSECVPKSKWTKLDKEIAKQALTVVQAPCLGCGKKVPMFFQDVKFTWCGECTNA